jgi:hypothetical protein
MALNHFRANHFKAKHFGAEQFGGSVVAAVLGRPSGVFISDFEIEVAIAAFMATY